MRWGTSFSLGLCLTSWLSHKCMGLKVLGHTHGPQAPQASEGLTAPPILSLTRLPPTPVHPSTHPPNPVRLPGVSVHQVMQVTAAVRTRMTAGTTAASTGPSVWTKSTATPASVLRATGEWPQGTVSD